MMKPIQCKDIDEKPILKFLFKNKICILHDDYDNSINKSFPYNTPQKLIIAKLYKLVKRGLIDGCCCGCRGDFSITNKGVSYLKNTLFAEYID